MGILDGPFRSLAKTLIGTLGASATLTRTTPGEYDPISGLSGMPRTTNYSVKISPPERYSRQDVATGQGAIQQDDFRVLVAASALSIEPSAQTDTLRVAGTVFKVIALAPVYSGDQVAAYEMQVRV